MPLELQPLSETAETLSELDELVPTDEVVTPALYPSAATFPSARTFPATGEIIPATGLQLGALSETTEALTALTED